MKKRKYIYTNKKNSDRAVMGTILGIISMASLGIVVFKAYSAGGETVAGFGFTGLLATVFALIGIVLGIVTVREKLYYKFFPVASIVLNFAVLASVALMLRMGNQ